MEIIKALPENIRANLRGNMHKVAAVMARNQGLPLMRDEVTIKEASYLLGVQFYKNYLEKKAMLDGIMHVMRLTQK
jgi:hypothetical protein